METSPRSSTATLSTTSSHPLEHETLSSTRTPPNAKTSAPRDTFPSHLTITNLQNSEADSVHGRKPSIPYAEIEKQEREREEREQVRRDEVKRHHDSAHVNAHSECGRHGDDWLFGGASVTESIKWLLGKK